MARPLRGAYARLTRANVHLRDFKRRAERFNRSHLDHLSYDFNPQTQLAHVHWDKGREPSAGMSIVVGETIYNLRAALDYLVYELARRDSRSEQNGTQFPIESTPEGFERRCDETRDRGVFLRGLLPEHKAAIKILQPCCGCNWTKLLADLSNPDKHRKLTDSPGTATLPHPYRVRPCRAAAHRGGTPAEQSIPSTRSLAREGMGRVRAHRRDPASRVRRRNPCL